MAAKAVHYQILKREMELSRELYVSMLQKVKEAGIVSAIRPGNIRVISPAKRPAHPYKPAPVLNASMGLIAGLFLGIVFAFVREHADRSLRVPGEATFYLDVPELATVPSVRPMRGVVGQTGPRALLQRWRKSTEPVELVAWQKKPSLLAESMRYACSSLMFAGQGPKPGLIVVTSPGPGEGKTTLVCNLGITIADTRRRVLLIDGDMRRPRLQRIFNLESATGLSDLLESELSIDEYEVGSIVVETHIPGLHVMSSGAHTVNLSDVRYSQRAEALLSRLRPEFDVILIDTPPMLHLLDAREFARLCDGAILVMRASKTKRDEAFAAQKRLREDGIPILGTILNDWDPAISRYGYYSESYRRAGAYGSSETA